MAEACIFVGFGSLLFLAICGLCNYFTEKAEDKEFEKEFKKKYPY